MYIKYKTVHLFLDILTTFNLKTVLFLSDNVASFYKITLEIKLSDHFRLEWTSLHIFQGEKKQSNKEKKCFSAFIHDICTYCHLFASERRETVNTRDVITDILHASPFYDCHCSDVSLCSAWPDLYLLHSLDEVVRLRYTDETLCADVICTIF